MSGIHYGPAKGNIMQLTEATTVGSTLTFDRAVATAAALVALAAAIMGGLALARSAGARRLRRSQIALTAGAAGTLVGVWVLAMADGGPGTGNGVVGGYASVVFGVIAVLLGGLAMALSRRRT
jgi:hypothetical protein